MKSQKSMENTNKQIVRIPFSLFADPKDNNSLFDLNDEQLFFACHMSEQGKYNFDNNLPVDEITKWFLVGNNINSEASLNFPNITKSMLTYIRSIDLSLLIYHNPSYNIDEYLQPVLIHRTAEGYILQTGQYEYIIKKISIEEKPLLISNCTKSDILKQIQNHPRIITEGLETLTIISIYSSED